MLFRSINFVEDMESLTTLTSVIERFKGKPLFIDFWFSTCAPCLREMKHSDGLKQWLEANDINMLYVSIDNDEMEKNWNNAIRYNKIYGNHLRATHDLHVDMDKNYGIRMYPSYMLVDASGNIVLPRTKEPSSGSELIEQLSQALDIN